MNGSLEAGWPVRRLRSWAAQGAAMRRAIAGDFARMPGKPAHVTVTLDARITPDAGPWSIVPVGAGEHDDRLRDLARAADFTVIIAPETRGVLASLTRDLEHAGARLMGSSPEAVLVAGEKARFGARLRSLGIDTPRTLSIDPSERLPEGASYPAVLKPIDGAGSVDTFFLEDARSVPEEARSLATALLQPFIPGTPMSASFLVARSRRCRPLAIGVQRVVIRAGRFSYHGGTLPADCLEALPQVEPAVAAIEGLRGFVGVDFVWDHERRACHDSRNQPAADDIDRRSLPAAASGPTGPGVAGRVRRKRRQPVSGRAGRARPWMQIDFLFDRRSLGRQSLIGGSHE